MNRLVRYQLFFLLLGLMIFFLAVSQFLRPEFLTLFLNSLTITIGVAVVATYIGPAIRGMANDPADRTSQLIFGITLMSASMVLYRFGQMRILDWAGSAAFSAAVSLLVFLSGVLHLSPQFNGKDGRITRRMWGIVAIVLCTTIVLAKIIIVVNPRVFGF